MDKTNILKKAVLFEVRECFNSETHQYDPTRKSGILETLVAFYIRFNDRFCYDVIMSDDAMTRGGDVMLEWSIENDIIFDINTVYDQDALQSRYIFKFVSEQDAIAFKLKWE